MTTKTRIPKIVTVTSTSGRTVIVAPANGKFTIYAGHDPVATEPFLIDGPLTPMDAMTGRTSGVRTNPAYTGESRISSAVSAVMDERPYPRHLFATRDEAVAAAERALAIADGASA